MQRRVRRMIETLQQNEKGQIEKKKNYLQTYRKAMQKVRRLELEIDEIRLEYMLKSPKWDGMPRGGSSQNDLSVYIIKLEQLTEDIEMEKQEALDALENIIKSIEKLEDEDQKDVLFLRYIKGKSFKWIAEEIKFSYRNVLYIHGKALQNFEIP